MEVKCINNDNTFNSLTVGKIYTVNEETEESYYIVNNNNRIVKYLKLRFIPVDENKIVYDNSCFSNHSFVLPDKNNIIDIALEIGELVEKKDKDYNSAFSKTLKEYGNVAYFLRIDDKLNRLKNLMLNNNNAEVNESVEDTLKDIIGYTLLMLKEIKS